MEISSKMPSIDINQNSKAMKTNFTEKISKDEAMEIREQISQNANAMMFQSTTIQANLSDKKDNFADSYKDFQSFLNNVGYEGKPIAELSQSEAAELVSEDGIFGVKETSQRIADFVINGAGGDEDKLRAGREGMLKGFKEAQQMWGGKLPEISQKTMQAAIEMVDNEMHDLGFSIINEEA